MKEKSFQRGIRLLWFEAYGAVMKEYVTVPESLLRDTKKLQPYFRLSYEYIQTLKPKPTKKKP
jgi:TfoX/Sxy family transcriptional regulator of competence genes